MIERRPSALTLSAAPDGMSAARCGVVELRRYTLYPGARETLIALFERELVAPQEAVGMQVLGQFRDLDRPDSFVWLRGFADLRARARALAAFYGGPVWRRHRDAANATMIDSDDVLLLRPAEPGGGLEPSVPVDPGAGPAGVVTVAACHLSPSAVAGFPAFFARKVEPALRAAGAPVLGRYETEPARNDFPALPVREGENVFVWVTRHRDQGAYARHAAAVRDALAATAGDRLLRAPELLRLEPTAGSRLRGG